MQRKVLVVCFPAHIDMATIIRYLSLERFSKTRIRVQGKACNGEKAEHT